MSDEMEMLSGRVPAELKEHVRNDPRPNQEVMKAALEREFATKEEAAVLRRLDELDREMSELKSQKNDRERKLNEKAEEKERLKKSLSSMEDASQRHLETILDKAAHVPAEPDHPFIVENAESVDMTPEELAREIADHHGKEYDPSDDDNGLRSL